jgi:HK97 family phage major capsid protein
MTIKEIQQQCGSLQDKMVALQKKADSESRKMSAEETAQWDRLDRDYNDLREDLLRRQKTEARAAELEGRVLAPPAEIRPGANTEKLSSTEHFNKQRSAFDAYLRHGGERMTTEHRAILEPLSDGRGYRVPQLKAAQGVGTGSTGGDLVPTGFSNLLEVYLKEYGGMREVSSMFPTPDGRPINWPTMDDTANQAVIIAENTTTTEQDITFGNVTFGAYKYSSKYIPVSVELLQDSFFNIEEIIAKALAVRIGRGTNADFTNGSGSGAPQGVVTGATLGTTGATGETTSIITDDLYNLEHSVDPAYRMEGGKASAYWMMADSTLKVLKKLKDSTGRMLWQPALAGMANPVPDTIDGFPYIINQSVPAMAANAASLLFGNFKHFVIRDVRDVTLVRLNELGALLGQVYFLAFSRHDSKLLNTNAVKYFANSAS